MKGHYAAFHGNEHGGCSTPCILLQMGWIETLVRGREHEKYNCAVMDIVIVHSLHFCCRWGKIKTLVRGGQKYKKKNDWMMMDIELVYSLHFMEGGGQVYYKLEKLIIFHWGLWSFGCNKMEGRIIWWSHRNINWIPYEEFVIKHNIHVLLE